MIWIHFDKYVFQYVMWKGVWWINLQKKKDYPEKDIKKGDEEGKISDTTNVKKSKIA